jgi:hypothetical protein
MGFLLLRQGKSSRAGVSPINPYKSYLEITALAVLCIGVRPEKSVRCVGVAIMSRARLRELVVLFAISSALTLAVFFLALWLLPFETFTRFPFPRFPALFN